MVDAAFVKVIWRPVVWMNTSVVEITYVLSLN